MSEAKRDIRVKGEREDGREREREIERESIRDRDKAPNLARSLDGYF